MKKRRFALPTKAEMLLWKGLPPRTQHRPAAPRTRESESIEIGRRAMATPLMRRDTTGLDLADEDVFGDLGDSFADGDVPDAPHSAASSSATLSHFKTRRPRSRQSSIIGRNDPPYPAEQPRRHHAWRQLLFQYRRVSGDVLESPAFWEHHGERARELAVWRAAEQAALPATLTWGARVKLLRPRRNQHR